MSQTGILLESGTNELEIVEFFLNENLPDGKEYKGYYGVNVSKVLSIINRPEVTELPNAPHPCVLGAFNQRSRIIPLVDLALWMGKQRIKGQDTKVIITEFNRLINGFLVSGVTRIHRLSWEEIEAPDSYTDKYSSNSITGVVKIEDRIVFLIDLEKIIAELNPGAGLKLDEELDWGTEKKYTALVADDSTLIRNMLGDLLEKAGFNVLKVKNGKEAWDELERFKTVAGEKGESISSILQIVISDIEMPMVDGLNLTKRIKTDPELKSLPVILFSSLISERLRHKGESVGADDQISKPEVSLLAQKAKSLIEESLT
ncbi:chemotaxis protein [Desulfonatronovibrio hydrogenovorans]|uniref:chemotaxis protein n=1 Tax=Desulfonatronovibrio hydrogenovorans TaxID=53245 RepID=UPI00048C3190|nr:chemotaxis protein [Desulfonatronovibrio hydrogenovorans]